MKKIGIITLNGYKNYGNRLQNYALQEAIKTIGFEVDTIIVDHSNVNSFTKKNYRLIDIKSIKRVVRRILGKNRKVLDEKRTNRFKKFTEKYINETNFKISENKIINENLSQYDKFIVGSDQVWNPFYINGSSLYFLSFAPITKRISYAASFGVSEIPNEHRVLYRKYLSEMKSLSVRENQGATIIREITGREAQVLIDPTMLLTEDSWKNIAEASNVKPDSPYLLTYFLGDISKHTKNKINEISNNENLEVVNLAQLTDKKYYDVSPSEFIDFIDSAEVFLTDSFHGVVFAILFKTPFIVFERQGKQPSMNSRIETLLSMHNFKSRLSENIDSSYQIYDIDFSEVDSILNKEREKAFEYLKDALH